MKYIIIAIGFALLTSFYHITTYDEIKGEPYHPIIAGQKGFYKDHQTIYSFSWDSIPTKISGKEYIKQTINYNNDLSIAYYRNDNGNVVYMKPGQKEETIEVPANPQPGMVWYESDSTWIYKITDLKGKLKTPASKFINCLVIQSEHIENNAADKGVLYMQYYQRGRGYVGTKINGQVYSYMLL